MLDFAYLRFVNFLIAIWLFPRSVVWRLCIRWVFPQMFVWFFFLAPFHVLLFFSFLMGSVFSSSFYPSNISCVVTRSSSISPVLVAGYVFRLRYPLFSARFLVSFRFLSFATASLRLAPVDDSFLGLVCCWRPFVLVSSVLPSPVLSDSPRPAYFHPGCCSCAG